MEQVLNQLPKGWINVQVKDVTKSLSSGFACNKSFETTDGYVHLRTHNISTSGCLNFDQIIKVSHEKIDEKKSKIFKGEILFNNTNSKELVGKTAYVDQDYDFSFSNHLTRIVPNDKVHSKFLVYWLVSLQTSGYFNQICKKWIGQAGVNNTVLKGLSVPLPSKEEQKRIVEKLDALLNRIDTAIEHLQESATLADALYASELNEVFPSDADIESLTDKDGWLSLSDICTFENGDRGKNYPSKSAFVAEGIPVVSAGNLGERYIDHKGLNYITPERYELLRSGRIRMGDILFCLRGSLGKVAISKDINEGVIASSLVIIRPKDQVSAEYIYKYLKSSLCQKFISYYNNGAAQPNLSAKSLGKFMLPLPNADQQKVIVDALDEKYQLNQKLLDGLNIKIISLQSLKASILDSAFKGEL